jgi:hypothetical protein
VRRDRARDGARYSVYLLYWYISANTSAEGAARCSICLLYWFMSANTDAEGAGREAGGGARHCLRRASVLRTKPLCCELNLCAAS